MNADSDREMERWLDAALVARMEAAESRSGLEERVLASLGARETNRPAWSWRWAAAFALALLAVMGIWLMIARPVQQRTVAQTTAKPQPLTSHVAPVPQPTASSARRVAPRITRVSHAAPVREDLPRLATFPAPEPPSEQERMIVAALARRANARLAGLTKPHPSNGTELKELRIEPLEGTPADDDSR
jgi:hypothetical protein